LAGGDFLSQSEFKDLLVRIIEGGDLSFKEAYTLFNLMLDESELRIAAVLSALQTKGYTAEEIAGFARSMRDKAVRVDVNRDVADTCGTGGDRSNTINVSTATALILSSVNPVAKHGNVSVTSKSGSANVLEALGINIRLEAEKTREMIEKSGFAFLFAPLYHPALKKIMPVRKELGIKTVFNILGPLCNPASPSYQLLGVSEERLIEKVSRALSMLGIKHAIVVHGNYGKMVLDEVSPCGKTRVAEVFSSGKVKMYDIMPEDFGIEPVKPVPCSSAEESAKRIEAVFSGNGKKEDLNFVLVNTSAALYVCEKVKDFKDGVELARNLIEEGVAVKKLEEIRNTQKVLG